MDTIRRTKRNKSMTIKLTKQEYLRYSKIGNYGINMSKMIRAFLNKVITECENYPMGSVPDNYFNKLEEILGVKNGR